MASIGRILVDEAHRQAWTIRSEKAAAMNPQNPADASMVIAADRARAAGFVVEAFTEGLFTAECLSDVDVLVIGHSATDDWESTTGVGSPVLTDAEMSAVQAFVKNGGGLLIVGETEAKKYGNSHIQLAAMFGISIDNATVQDPTRCHKDVATWVLAERADSMRVDLLAGVDDVCFYRAGTLSADDDAVTPVLKASASSSHPNEALLMVREYGAGRVAVVADSDLFGDDSITELSHLPLWMNLMTWLTRHAVADSTSSVDPVVETTAWKELVAAVETIRPLQNKDGSVIDEHRGSAELLAAAKTMMSSIETLAPQFSHQADHLAATVVDIQKWIDGGFGVPDFFDSLMLFHPDQHRIDGIKNFVVFPMYTQNGNLNRNFEAVITKTFWPDWLAEQERTKYHNPAFVPIEFVGTTEGYNTHSAVLFPETVATREVGTFTWGGIFCDRESARFRRIATEASGLLKLSLPAAAELLLARQSLAQETFVLWDLIHDRAHSHGDLPFDPFMIKQRMPYW
ncbi:MAG: hypothetical protein RL441_255, partial [Actinomycetota bacterium]